ncbi:MAG TPA: 50S ribosomal protein L37ae [Methanomassiliicoccales archaeon]|nr:50S ribosomal protein L37ae [Methanomassiliicoccales archaeon]
MAKGTEKMGSAGRFGARYGVVVRKLTRDIEKIQKSKFECPTCHHKSVKREACGIWECRHCDAKFAAAAYAPTRRAITSKDISAAKDKVAGGEKPGL